MTNETQLREKAIEYLSQRVERPRGKDEFTINEICEQFGLSERIMVSLMKKLVDEGIWETRIAYVEDYHHRMRLWRMKT